MIGRPGRSSVLTAVAVWTGVLASRGWAPGLVEGRRWGMWAVVACVSLLAGAALAARHPRFLLGLALAAGSVAGFTAHGADAAVWEAPLPEGPVEMLARTVSDPLADRYGWRQVIVPVALVTGGQERPWAGPHLVLASDERLVMPPRSMVAVGGRLVPEHGRVRGRAVAGRVAAATVAAVTPPQGPVWGTVEWLRGRVTGSVVDRGDGGALLAGFLVGDTSALGDADVEALRRAGLSHFVAVSGSNVALFLGLWWLLLAPLSRHPRLRAASGVAGVVLFALVTRAEPSVVRASAMVAVLLAGRVAGWAFDRWTALGLGVTGCLLVSGRLAFEVGFQLSVAATAGVMAGADLLHLGPRPVRTVLGASLAAQLAVAPIVLAVFGSMPLLAPLSNLVAAPLVTVATGLGGVGTLAGLEPLISAGATAAGLVLEVARMTAPWPQVGPETTFVLLALGTVARLVPRLRRPAVLAAVVACGLVVFPPTARLDLPAVVFFDVGQGDAALVVSEDFTMLVDGGPDPAVLADRLRRYGVDRVDLLVASHVHSDHVAGLAGLAATREVGEAWMAFEGHETPASAALVQELGAAGVPVRRPSTGSVVRKGDVAVEVLGPLRRYASPNDQSIVLRVLVAGRTVLFPGDVEVVAQSELGTLEVDVLKVPHQGAATSEPGWLEATRPRLAVVSVGPNRYGHPAGWVIDTLATTGATVLRTDEVGDVILEPAGARTRRPRADRRRRGRTERRPRAGARQGLLGIGLAGRCEPVRASGRPLARWSHSTIAARLPADGRRQTGRRDETGRGFRRPRLPDRAR